MPRHKLITDLSLSDFKTHTHMPVHAWFEVSSLFLPLCLPGLKLQAVWQVRLPNEPPRPPKTDIFNPWTPLSFLLNRLQKPNQNQSSHPEFSLRYRCVLFSCTIGHCLITHGVEQIFFPRCWPLVPPSWILCFCLLHRICIWNVSFRDGVGWSEF